MKINTNTRSPSTRLLYVISRFLLATAIWAMAKTACAEKGDFNGDGKADILWQNTSTGARTVWVMNGTAYASSLNIKPRLTSVDFAGVSDFNADGHADILVQSTSGVRSILLLTYPNGNPFSQEVPLGTVSTAWQIVGAGDFNGDNKPDILWQNISTGARAIWIMNGTAFSGNSVSLGTVSTPWNIVASGDFNGDSKADILWQNSATGERVVWLMNGTVRTSTVSLGIVSTQWNIGGSGDFSGDNKPDILWQNSATGERVIWLMNGTVRTSTVSLGIVSTPWDIRNH